MDSVRPGAGEGQRVETGVGVIDKGVGILDALERDLGRPVISANQASLWRCLRLSGVHATISGYGSLLSR